MMSTQPRANTTNTFHAVGTGKTTLCKALAQKVFVRNCTGYSSGVLLEINSHSLFSRWFSESGKLVRALI
jgi:pachytene checkpoint protein 2